MPEKTTTSPEFMAIFRVVVLALQPRGPIDRDLVHVYWDVLQSFPLDVLHDTARVLRETRRFFPTSGEWAQLARELQLERRRADISPICPRCGGRGLIRIDYRTGEPFDIAICDCAAGEGFRVAGERLVRLRLQLTPEQQVGWIEDFNEGEESR
jgi:hypothetical protein